MGVSFATSDGISIGYSGSSCYLAGPLLVGVSTVLPVSLLLLLNLLLFVLTVRRIRQVSQAVRTTRKLGLHSVYHRILPPPLPAPQHCSRT